MSKIRGSAALLILLLAAALIVSQAWKLPAPTRLAGVAVPEIPAALNGYSAASDDPDAITPEVRSALSSADIETRSYVRADAPGAEPPIDFVLVRGTDRTALHDPRSCLVAGGWRITQDHAETLPGANGIRIHACHIVNESLPGSPSSELLYVYVVDGHIIESVTEIRARMLLAALIGKRNTPVTFLRFQRGLEPDRSDDGQNQERDATTDSKDLRAFAAAMWQKLDLIKS